MFLSKLCIDQHGECSDLCIDSVAPGLNVVYGKQASGKSKAVEFLRTTLFDSDPNVAPLGSANELRKFDGSLSWMGPHGRQTIRRDDWRDAARLTVENDRGETTDASAIRELRELYGDLSPKFLEQIFVVDFERQPSVPDVLQQASQFGLDVTDRAPDATRLEATERDLAKAVSQLQALPEPAESWEWLGNQRRQILDGIALLEARERRRIDEHELQQGQWRSQFVELERQLGDARRELASRDVTISLLLERRQQLEADRAALLEQPAQQSWSRDVSEIDARLDRWQLVLREIAVAKTDTAATESNRDAMAGESATSHSRRHLAAIEATTLTLQTLLSQQASRRLSGCSCHELNRIVDESLREIRQEIYQLCHSLNVWHTAQQQQLRAAQNQQFARCESELQLAIQTLTDRRQHFLATLKRPETTLRPDHHDLCECAEHSRLIDKADDHSPQLEMINAQLWEVDAELRQSEQRRNQLEHQIADLNARIKELQKLLAPHLSELDGTLAELNAKRILLASVERSISQWASRRELLTRIACLEDELQLLRTQSSPSVILSEASDIARQLSDGAIQRIAYDRGRFWTETNRGTRAEWHELSDVDRDQVNLAVHFALAAACERRGARLPIVVKSPFSNASDRQVSDAIRFLKNFAQGRQILCFTSDDHAVQAARAANVRVGVLTLRPESVRTESESVPPRISHTATTHEKPTFEKAADSSIAHARDFDPSDFDDAELSDDDDWSEDDPIERLSDLSIVEANQLRNAGVRTISDFLESPIDNLAERLQGTSFSRDRLSRMHARGQRLRRSRRNWSRGNRRSRLGERSRREANSNDGSSRSSRRSGFDERGFNESSRTGSTASSSTTQRVIPITSSDGGLRFYLHRRDHVEAAPSIGAAMANRLSDIGVITVENLINSNPESVATKLGLKQITGDTIRQWQRQSEFVCRIPQLRGHDAQILVAIDVLTPEQLAASAPAEIWSRVKRFLSTDDCKRILRGSTPPDLEEVTDWIAWSQQARPLAAA